MMTTFTGPVCFQSRPRGVRARTLLRRLAPDENGATMVETAVSLALLLTIVIGIMEISQALYAYHFISEAAREGTRYAVVRGSSCPAYGGFSTACPATEAEIQSYIEGLGYPGIKSGNMTVTAAWSAYPAGTACTPSSTCNNPGNLVQVTVAYKFPLSIPFVKASTINMSSTSEMVISD